MSEITHELVRPEPGSLAEYLWKKMDEDMPFFKLLGLETLKVTEEEIIGKLEIRHEHMNSSGFVHGGVLFTMIDTYAGALGVFLYNSGVVTVNSHVEYLRPAMSGTIYCRGTIIKKGNNFFRAMGEVFDEEGNLLVTSMNTYFPIGAKVEDK